MINLLEGHLKNNISDEARMIKLDGFKGLPQKVTKEAALNEL